MAFDYDWFLRFLADILGLPVERPVDVESTALGAAYLAGLCAGVFDSTATIAAKWQREAVFNPEMNDDQRDTLLDGWKTAVNRVRSHA